MAAAVLQLVRDEGIIEAGDDFGPDDDLFAAGLDSMAVMQLLVAAGERWGVHFDAADVTKENFATAAALANLIKARRR